MTALEQHWSGADFGDQDTPLYWQTQRDLDMAVLALLPDLRQQRKAGAEHLAVDTARWWQRIGKSR